MAEVDTSSYPRLPANPPSFLDTAGKIQGLQSGALTMQQQQLNLIKDRFKQVAGQIPGLLSDPNLNQDKVMKFYRNQVDNGFMTADQAATHIGQIPPTQGMQPAQAALTLKNHLGNQMQQAMSIMEALDYHLPRTQILDQNNQQTPITISRKPGQPPVSQSGPSIPQGIPPTLPTITSPEQATATRPVGTPTIMGPNTSPTGLPSAPGALPVGNMPVPQGMKLGGGTVTGIQVGPDQPNMGGVPSAGLPTRVPTQSIRSETPQTGLAPGIAAPMQASGEQLANDRTRAASFQRDIFPLMQAIPDLEKLGTKGTGPGTDTINNLKSFVLSNVPGIKASDFSPLSTVADYDKAKKYLTDFVNQTGNSGTNDKLAASFAGNPSVHISNAAAVDVAKSALALRRMQQAQLLMFEQSGLPASQYSQWVAQTTNKFDPRAFGIDMMNAQAKQKLLAQLNKNPTEKANFEATLKSAQGLGFLTPPSGTAQ